MFALCSPLDSSDIREPGFLFLLSLIFGKRKISHSAYLLALKDACNFLQRDVVLYCSTIISSPHHTTTILSSVFVL